MTFDSAVLQVQTLLRSALQAGKAGDPGAVSAELVQAALVLGAQMGALQVMYGANYPASPQAKTLSRLLSQLQMAAVQAFSYAEDARTSASTSQSLLDTLETADPEHETPYATSADEYQP